MVRFADSTLGKGEEAMCLAARGLHCDECRLCRGAATDRWTALSVCIAPHGNGAKAIYQGVQ